MTAPWVAIQRNPVSGAGAKRAEILALCKQLRRLGIRLRVFSRRERLAERLGRPDGRNGLICLVAAGGDGTVGDLINRFPDLPLTILPLGTENLLARHLGIPCNGQFVAEVIAQGITRRIDIGLLNGKRFTLMVSAGFDADVVHRTHGRRQGNIRKSNYIQPILETLRTYRYPEMRVAVDEEGPPAGGSLSDSNVGASPVPLSGRLVVVANIPEYALGLPIAGSAVGDDGLLDLRVFQRPSAFQMMRYLYKVARRQHEELADVRVARIRTVRIDSDVPVPLQCDGDPAGWTPAEISVLPGALTLLVPRSAGPASGSSRDLQ
jgi:diacylglycerol kinase family enzyme